MKKRLVLLLIVCTSSLAQAELVFFSAIPSTWRLQNYAADSTVVAWFTPSPCTNGLLSFPSTATVADKNRFWALVLAAKLAQKSIFVYYDNGPNCVMNSYGMDTP